MEDNLLGSKKAKISAKEFGAKYKSKYEIFRFLTVDVHAYLSAYHTVSIYFLKDLISGSKRCKLATILTRPF